MEDYFTLMTSHTPVLCHYPEKCPICKKNIFPKHVYDWHDRNSQNVTLIFSCPACQQCFVSNGKFDNTGEEKWGTLYQRIILTSTFPETPKSEVFNENIKNLSPDFCEIYNHALASESYNLFSLSGMGYRKSLEFLIKDYCIFKNPNETNKIKNMILGQVINKYIDNYRIQNLAKAATWLGNDETHYIHKFENKDINDLKKFISTVVAFITYELVSDEADKMVS